MFRKRSRAIDASHDVNKMELLRLRQIARNPDAPDAEREKARRKIQRILECVEGERSEKEAS